MIKYNVGSWIGSWDRIPVERASVEKLVKIQMKSVGCFFLTFIYLFIYLFWLHWVLVVA